jgi:hypothetical protein
MKKSCVIVIIGCLSSIAMSATVATWVGPTGSWSDGTKWSTGSVPPVGGSTSDEIKITNTNTVCTVDSAIAGTYGPRIVVAAAATLEIVPGGSIATLGEYRFGDANATGNGSKGYGVQTGGTVRVKDVVLGRYTATVGRETGQGFYTISGGTLTYLTDQTGRLYVGAGSNSGYCEGTFTVIGTGGVIDMKQMHVGNSGSEASYPGKGTLQFQITDNGVSSITLSDRYSLTFAGLGNDNESHLVLSSSSNPPAANIVLVNVTSSQANQGVFDTMNGGSAAEGTQIVLGNKIYSLTYHYAHGGGTANDIALLYVAGLNERAHSPNPVPNAVVETTLALLDWVNPDPNNGIGPVYCDVYLGTEPNRLLMDKKTLANNVSEVSINTDNFQTKGSLQNKTWYYWVVDVHDSSANPTLRTGIMWSFYTDNNYPPEVNAGSDQVKWLTAGQVTVNLDATVIDDGLPGPYTVLWTKDSGDAAAAINQPTSVDTSVTITARGTYVFRLTANDGDKQAYDTVQIMVGSTACDAWQMSTGADYKAADLNKDCIVNLLDLSILAQDWLVCSDTLTNCAP